MDDLIHASGHIVAIILSLFLHAGRSIIEPFVASF